MSNETVFREFALNAIQDMLSYNITELEAYNYLTNRIKLCDCSYELQCCIFDNDPIEYFKEIEKLKKGKK